MLYLISILATLFDVAATLHLLLRYRRPESAVAWLFAIWFLPIVGSLSYFTFTVYGAQRKLRGRRGSLARSLRNSRSLEADEVVSTPKPSIERALDAVMSWPTVGGNRVTWIVEAEPAYEAMFDAMDQARENIVLMTYILRSDVVGQRLLETLSRCRARGVEVRILIDAIGSWRFRAAAARRFRAAGLTTARSFSTTFLPGRLQVNFRNHRKLLIIDDRVAFTGGRNWGDEYAGTGDVEHPYHDLTVRVEGPAVSPLMRIFEEDWSIATKSPLRAVPPPSSPTGDHSVRVIASGPDEPTEVLPVAFGVALRSARDEIYLVTPYFVPGRSLISSLCNASLAGVSVHILLPTRSDSRLVDWAARRDFTSLLGAGVKITLVEGSFVHTKALVVDREFALVGSANFDWRSLHLNFELNLAVTGNGVASELRDNLGRLLNHGRRVDPEAWEKRGTGARLLENGAGLFGPLL